MTVSFFYCSYYGREGFYLDKIDSLSELEEIEFVYENKAIDMRIVRFLQSKMAFFDDNFLYIANKIHLQHKLQMLHV